MSKDLMLRLRDGVPFSKLIDGTTLVLRRLLNVTSLDTLAYDLPPGKRDPVEGMHCRR